MLEEGKTTCCYAQSEKSWILDPQGVSWETFITTGDSTVYGTTAPRLEPKPAAKAAACCGPAKAEPSRYVGGYFGRPGFFSSLRGSPALPLASASFSSAPSLDSSARSASRAASSTLPFFRNLAVASL